MQQITRKVVAIVFAPDFCGAVTVLMLTPFSLKALVRLWM
jgi:hypothetical protein